MIGNELFTALPVPANRNCFYTSVAYFLQRDYQEMKHQCLEFILENSEYFQSFMDDTIQKKKCKFEVWADNIKIRRMNEKSIIQYIPKVIKENSNYKKTD